MEIASEVQRVSREVARYQQESARLSGLIVPTTRDVETTKAEIDETEASFRRGLSEETVAAQLKMLAARERLKSHDDRLARIEIKAPVSGQVLVATPRWRRHHLSNHGVTPDGRLIWPEPPHGGGWISRNDRFRGWWLVD